MQFRLKVPCVLAVLLALLSGLAGPAGPRPAAGEARLDPALVAQLHRDGRGTFLVVLAEQADLAPAYAVRDWDARGWLVYNTLRETAARTQPAVLRALGTLQAGGHVSRFQPFYVRNLIVVEGDLAAARALARQAEVEALYPNLRVEPVTPVQMAAAPAGPQAVEWNIERIRADEVWAAYGVTGTGVVVANIDSGVEYTHTALVHQYRGNLGGGVFEHDYNWWDPTHLYDYPADDDGHGTHVMGISVGADISRTNQIGVAPGARWVAVYSGDYTLEHIFSATQWTIAPTDRAGNNPDPARRPHVVNNSWGIAAGSLYLNSLLEVQRAAGIMVVFAAGNSGGICGTLLSPGDNPAVVNVGASMVDESIVFFSSRGPNPFGAWYGRFPTGPDLSAPGVGVRSAIPGGGYEDGDGTSMASPHVAGAVALLWSAEPDLLGRVDETANLLRHTAVPLTSTQQCGGVLGTEVPNNTSGWGRLDVKAAVDMVWQAGTLAGQVRAAGSGVPLAGAQLLAQRAGYTLTATTGPAGDFSLLLGQGAYTVTVRAYGHDALAAAITVTQDVTTTWAPELPPRAVSTLSGAVQEQGTGEPVAAQVGLYGTGVDLSTDPATGAYSASVADGGYTMRVVARGYQPAERAITVTGSPQEDVTLAPRWSYYVRDSRSPCGPAFDWIDVTYGEPHYLGNSGTYAIWLPDYHFPFYGADHTYFSVSANGFVSLMESTSLQQMVFPFEGPPNYALYGFYTNLNPANGAQGIVYDALVEGRYLVVEFYQVQHDPSGNPETWEVILDRVTGAVVFQYLVVSWPDLASVGVENADGSDGILYSYANSAAITDGLAVGFYPVYGGLPADQGVPGVVGTLSGTVHVSGTATPVPGALVTATSPLAVLTETAGSDGRYLLADVCADLYRLEAAAPGYEKGPAVEARLRWPGAVVERDLAVVPLAGAPALTKTVQLAPCGPVTYTLAYANRGDAPVRAVISDVLPAELVYITATPPGVVRGSQVTWTVDIPVNAAEAVTVVAGLLLPLRGTVGSAVTNTAYLLWPGPALSSSAALSYRPVDLVLTKTVIPTAVLPGELVTYTLGYANRGCGPAAGAVLSDTWPAAVAYMTATPPGVAAGGVITWAVDLEAGAVGTATVVGRLTTTVVPGTVVSNAAVLGHGGDSAAAAASFLAGCLPVAEAALSWTPPAPWAGAVVTLTGAAAGSPPITYTWSLGDGSPSVVGAAVTHTYALPGAYTVTLTAANCRGAGRSMAQGRIVVGGRYQIYLPLVMRGG